MSIKVHPSFVAILKQIDLDYLQQIKHHIEGKLT